MIISVLQAKKESHQRVPRVDSDIPFEDDGIEPVYEPVIENASEYVIDTNNQVSRTEDKPN